MSTTSEPTQTSTVPTEVHCVHLCLLRDYDFLAQSGGGRVKSLISFFILKKGHMLT